MTDERIIQQFDAAAADYDSQRRKLIPCFDDFYGMAVSWASAATDAPRIADLGAGTGLFAGMVKRKYPDARITLIDVSDNMIAEARARFGDDPLVDCIVADYTKHEFAGPYDIVLSSLSIHHLTHRDKRELFHAVHRMLTDGGVFVNADQAAGASPFFDRKYGDDWRRAVRASGLTAEAVEAAVERRKLDRNATVNDQLTWLREAGFAETDCVYKYNEFAVFYARKGCL
ncbi:class I SAM-dependent methyltransferase [Paenibacillus sp. GYB003]|uniref:class I SAM-dependent methyltransferase n=1 Tax=Paenibacillus sp. GYB003 TaxID=2994392 RepID=UPI002F96D25D